MASEFFGRQRECRFSTAGCWNKMAVSVTGPRAVNELGGPVIPGNILHLLMYTCEWFLSVMYVLNDLFPLSHKCSITNVGLMLVHRLRRWTNNKPTFVAQNLVFAGM